MGTKFKAVLKYYRMTIVFDRSPVEKVLGTLVNENLEVTQQSEFAAQKGNLILGCIKGSMTSSRSRDMILPHSLILLLLATNININVVDIIKFWKIFPIRSIVIATPHRP